MEAIPLVRSSLSGTLLVVVKLSALVRRGLEVGGQGDEGPSCCWMPLVKRGGCPAPGVIP